MLTLGNTEKNWGAVSKFIHWVIALCIITAMLTAIVNNQLAAEGWQRELATELINVHRSCGITALFLGILRIIWLLVSRRPQLPDNLNNFDRKSAVISHRAIYALALLVPITGWMATSAFGTTFEWFYLFEVTNPLGKNRGLVPYFYHAHWILYHLLLVLVILHVGAAFWHHFSQKDDVLRKMLPFGLKGTAHTNRQNHKTHNTHKGQDP